MAFSTSYTFDLSPEKKFVNFEGLNGEKYVLIHELTWTVYGNSILNMAVECDAQKNVLITAELCTANVNPVKTTAHLDGCKANLNFQNVNFLTPDPWSCVITVIPHLQLRNLPESSTSVPALLQNKKSEVKKAKLEKLSADMQSILNSGYLSDVVLTDDDGVIKIPAHKAVLAARSPVFGKMFQHKMKENVENCVAISDIPGEVLKDLIYFIYTGTIIMKDAKMVRELYIAADKYAVIDLRELCSEVLQNLSLDDALDTLALADLFEDMALRHSALNFIAVNYCLMKDSSSWESFMKGNPTLAVEILQFIIAYR